MMFKLKLNSLLFTSAVFLLASNFAQADPEQKQNKSSEHRESQTPDAYPSTESPHGISERSNENSSTPSGSFNKSTGSEGTEKRKSSSSNGGNTQRGSDSSDRHSAPQSSGSSHQHSGSSDGGAGK